MDARHCAVYRSVRVHSSRAGEDHPESSESNGDRTALVDAAARPVHIAKPDVDRPQRILEFLQRESESPPHVSPERIRQSYVVPLQIEFHRLSPFIVRCSGALLRVAAGEQPAPRVGL
jgi:hypothetical protein